jgi:heat shock protein HslJ
MPLRIRRAVWPPLLLVLIACAAGADPEVAPTPAPAPAAPVSLPAEVLASRWEWVSFTTPVEQLTVDDSARYTIELDDTGFVAIQADCNRGVGNYYLPGRNQIMLHGIALTRAACPAGSYGERFVTLLGLVRTWFVQNGDFYLELPASSERRLKT